MANGIQLSDENLGLFTGWVASKTDADFRQIVSRGVLSRTEIARECGFSKSALNQNPRIKKMLNELEIELRRRGVLPELAENLPDGQADPTPMRVPSSQQATRDAETLRRLQTENASQKAEIASQRAEITELKRRLAKYESLHDALVNTGRLPR